MNVFQIVVINRRADQVRQTPNEVDSFRKNLKGHMTI